MSGNVAGDYSEPEPVISGGERKVSDSALHLDHGQPHLSSMENMALT